MPACHVFVSGRVQGVFFRASTQQQAQRLGLAGWVRNVDDGRVEAWLEGDAEALASMRAWLRQGPPQARVDTIDETEESEQGLSGFEVKR